AHFVEDVHGARLPVPQLLDERHALLELRLARLELLDRRQHRPELVGLHFGARDFRVEPPPAFAQRPEPPAHGDERRQHDRRPAPIGRALAGGAPAAFFRLRRSAATARGGVWALPRPPPRRSPSPTATATVGAISNGSVLNRFESNETLLNGSNDSTGASKRSVSISVKPSARDAPPLSMIRSILSGAAGALNKSNVFWISRITVFAARRRDARASS